MTAVAAYLLGNLNGAVVISRIVAHEDVRTKGSGNAGLTNFTRNYGAHTSVFVILIDVGKAVAACLLGGLLLKGYGHYADGVALGGLFVILGHDFPVLLGFRGVEFVSLLGIFASPTAINSFTMAQQMGGDEELAGDIVIVTSAASAFTFCGWIFLFKSLGIF